MIMVKMAITEKLRLFLKKRIKRFISIFYVERIVSPVELIRSVEESRFCRSIRLPGGHYDADSICEGLFS
jgi:hypothetical protein